MKKLTLTLLMMLAIMVTGQAQNKKMKEKANEWVKNLNSELVSVDPALALTADQETAIYTLQIERLTEVKALRKESADKEALQAVNKKYNQKIMGDILTKKQKKARQQARKKAKDD